MPNFVFVQRYNVAFDPPSSSPPFVCKIKICAKCIFVMAVKWMWLKDLAGGKP